MLAVGGRPALAAASTRSLGFLLCLFRRFEESISAAAFSELRRLRLGRAVLTDGGFSLCPVPGAPGFFAKSKITRLLWVYLQPFFGLLCDAAATPIHVAINDDLANRAERRTRG